MKTSNHWNSRFKNFQSLELFRAKLPIIGTFFRKTSKGWNFLLVAAFVMLAGCARPRHPEENAAIYAAQMWMQDVDRGVYAASWSNAASYFRGMVAEDRWAQMISAGRGPLGVLQTRDFKSARHYTCLPGAPDGDYIVIQFKTSFANKMNAIETITPMKETDGEWRVSGYFVK